MGLTMIFMDLYYVNQFSSDSHPSIILSSNYSNSYPSKFSSEFFIRFTLLSFNIISIDFLQINELLYVFSFVNTCMLIPLHSFGSHTRTHTQTHSHVAVITHTAMHLYVNLQHVASNNKDDSSTIYEYSEQTALQQLPL